MAYRFDLSAGRRAGPGDGRHPQPVGAVLDHPVRCRRGPQGEVGTSAHPRRRRLALVAWEDPSQGDPDDRPGPGERHFHIDGGSRAAERAERAMRHIDGLTVDAVIATGVTWPTTDPRMPNTRSSARSRRRATRRSSAPATSDSRGPFLRGPARLRWGRAGEPGLFVGSFSIVLVDSSIPAGPLVDSPPPLAWLDATLSEAPGQAFVGMHHQASTLHIPLCGRHRPLRQPRRFWPTLSAAAPTSLAVISAYYGGSHHLAGVLLLLGFGVVSTGLTPYETESRLRRSRRTSRPASPSTCSTANTWHPLSGGHSQASM